MKLYEKFKKGDIVEITSMHSVEPHNNSNYTHCFMRVPLIVNDVYKHVYGNSNHYIYLNANLVEPINEGIYHYPAGYNIAFGAVKIRFIKSS